jgi:hypothetical protein
MKLLGKEEKSSRFVFMPKILSFVFLWNWACKAGALLLDTSSPFWSGYYGDWGLSNYLPGLASNCNPPDLSLPCSYDYKCESLAPSCKSSYSMIHNRKIDKLQKNVNLLLYKRNCAEDKNRTYRLGENIFKLHN